MRILRSASRFSSAPSWMSMTAAMSSWLSAWKMIVSSIRLRNSGRKCAPQRLVHLPAHPLVELAAAAGPFGDELAAQVRGHDDDGVAEVDRAALAVGQPPVVEQLQQHVQHFRVRLLDLVEQHHGVGPAPHRLGQLSGLVVADVARGRADHARDGVLLLVLGHVDAHHRMVVVEQELGQRPRQLGLADAGRPEEDEAAERPLRDPAARPGPGGWRWPRPGSPRPARRRGWCRRSSILISFWTSPSISRLTGMPVHLATTSAMSSSSTCSFSRRGPRWCTAHPAPGSAASSSGIRPYCSSDARA